MRRYASLFEPRPREPALRDEVAAVARGRRAVVVQRFAPAQVRRGDHRDFVRLAIERGLEVIRRRDVAANGDPVVAIHALREGDEWRVPALHALWTVFATWSDGAHVTEAAYLGLSEDDRAERLARARHARCGWTGTTIYLVLSRAQRRILATTGNRWLLPEAFADGIPAIRADAHVARRRLPGWLARERMTLARIAITGELADRLFGSRGAIQTRELTADDAPVLNAALQSLIELYDGDTWSSAVRIPPRMFQLNPVRPTLERRLASLFRRRSVGRNRTRAARVGYGTLAAEIRAVARGELAMTATAWELRDTAAIAANPEFDVPELIVRALRLGLTVVEIPWRYQGCVHVPIYFVRPETAWRAPALSTLRNTFYEARNGWALDAEDLDRYLRGFDPARRRRARAYNAYQGYGGMSLWFTLTSSQRRAIAAVRGRYIPDEAFDPVLTVARFTNRTIRVPAPRWIAYRGLELARATVKPEYSQMLHARVGRQQQQLYYWHLTRDDARAFNAGLVTNIEILGPRGWRAL